MSKRLPGLFITGTDTGVGKTYVTAMIARALKEAGLQLGVYKPVASGCVRVQGKLVSEDAWQLWEAAGRPGEFEHVCPQCFEAPLAPPVAARASDQVVNEDYLLEGLRYWEERSEFILVEGAGGLFTPASEALYVADVALDMGFPLIVVSRNSLGTINHTMSTLLAASMYGDGLRLAGIVLNDVAPPGENDDPSRESNLAELVDRCETPVLAHVPWNADRFDPPVDWLKLAE